MATGETHLQYQVTRGGPIFDVDLTVSGVTRMQLKVSKSAPACLTWYMAGNQFDNPIPSGSYVRMWVEGEAWEGHGFGTGHPCFEGFCRTTPGEQTGEVKYTAYDCSVKAASDIDVMSEPWIVNGSGAIVPNPVSIPRQVLNTFNVNDDDWQLERAHLLTTGQILAMILDDALLPLRYYYAAPDADVAYESSDLAELDYISLKKVVFQSEDVRGTLNRILADNEPSYTVQWLPGFRKFRFQNQASAPTRTYVLNDPAADDVVLDCRLVKSVAGTFTAVELYGPQSYATEAFSTTDGTLINISGTGTVLETYTDGTGSHIVYGENKWQIADPAKRIGNRLLPEVIQTPVTTMFLGPSEGVGGLMKWAVRYVPTIAPVLQASWDNGGSYITVSGILWDFQNGIITMGNGNFLYMQSAPPSGGSPSTQSIYNATNVRIVYAPLSNQLEVRYPPTGFEGTAYTEENVTATYRQFHPMLAVDEIRGVQITTPDRIAQYEKLAWAIHKQRSKTIWAGGIVVDGLKWDLVRLNRRINIAGVDADGNTLTVGTENMGAVLTEATYDFENQTTSLTFSSNDLENMGYSVDLLMQQLHIRALARRTEYRVSHTWGFIQTPWSWNGNSGVWAINGTSGQVVNSYYDPLFGTPGTVKSQEYGMSSALRNPQGLPQ